MTNQAPTAPSSSRSGTSPKPKSAWRATPGERVRSLVLDDGTVIVENGAVVAGDPLDVATIDFLARGGDGYPFLGLPFTTVGVSYQQALANYIEGPLLGAITAVDYPEGGEGRITVVP